MSMKYEREERSHDNWVESYAKNPIKANYLKHYLIMCKTIIKDWENIKI
jgi:hypothetical protein